MRTFADPLRRGLCVAPDSPAVVDTAAKLTLTFTELDLRCRVARLGRSSMRFIIEMYRADEHLVTGEVIYVCARPATHMATQTSAPVPDTLRERILNFEILKPET